MASHECVVCAVAVELVAMRNPAGWRALRAEHVSNGDGGCRSCRDAARGVAQPWPCLLRLIAERAEQMHSRDQATACAACEGAPA